jgi:hypothetical protein
MNADLTFNSVVLKKNWDDPVKGSLRSSVARAINTPDLMMVKSQDYVDSVTKVAGTRYTVRLDRHDLDATNQKIISSIYAVLAVPSTVTSAQFAVLTATFKAAVADTDLFTNVLNGEK